LLNLVNGEQWYTTQAYRALNQALGRCLRHRADWGALVMVDDRFLPTGGQAGNSKKISKWVRQQLLVFPSFQDFETGLSSFVSKMTADDSLKSAESSTS
jgi:Fanconi anemia group J protein